MASVDGTPFLSNLNPTLSPSSVRAQGLRHAARMVRLASTGRRGMREPSMAVRERAAQEIEDRQVNWAYSSPVVAFDIAWNSTFVVATAAALLLSRTDALHLPLRLWAAGYALQCVVHVVCVCVLFRRRRRLWGVAVDDQSSNVIRYVESANTMFSFIWWMIGFYWICFGGHALQQDSPTLYWLCIVFLALDLFFVMFCVALASVIAAAVCCCLPCIIAILYVLAERQGGASKEDIELLPKYTFFQIGGEKKVSDEAPGPCEGIMTECETDNPIVRRLTAEDAECCICISAYEDGDEVRELPCLHHFHCTCIDKWLYINSTCPLCKFDISKHYTQTEDEFV